MPARDRTLKTVTSRLESTERAEIQRRSTQQPALYDGTGTIKALGAASGVPVRGLNATSSLAVGQPVGANQGIVNGLPDAVTQEAFQAAVNLLSQQIGNIRNRRGIQVFDGDPNASTPPAYQDFNFQFLYDQQNRKVYYADPSDGVTPTEWIEIEIGGSGADVVYSPDPPEYDSVDPVNNPPPGNPPDGRIHVDTTTGRHWRYRAETNTYYNISGALHFTRQVPGMSNPDRFVRGDRLTLADTINEGKYCEYEFRPPGGTEPTGTTSDWRLITCCDSCPDDIPDGSCDEGLWQHNGSGQWFCCTTPSNQDIFSS